MGCISPPISCSIHARVIRVIRGFSLCAFLLATAFLSVGLTAVAADYEPGTPSTYLFDTGTASASRLATEKIKPKDWTLVPEDDLTHKIRGDAVLVNDRLAVVLRSAGAGAEVYGQTNSGPKYRVEIAPRGSSGQKPAALSSVRILENGPAAVTLAGTFAAAGGGSCSLKYRITAGQMIVEVRSGQGTEQVAVSAEIRYMAVPEFFGFDMVFSPQAAPRPRLRLPTENMLVSLLDGGNAEVMCVWPSNRQEAVALQSKGAIDGCEIKAIADKPLWVACLEGAGLWHEQPATSPDTTIGHRKWNPPFAAKWRVDLLQGLVEAQSSWLRDDGTIHLATSNRTPYSYLIYAMDRSQATPLTTFTPVDILRGTLGVGPCQYILQTEGLGSDANPTPDNVMTWVEKQFSRNKEKKVAGEIREKLAQMVEHVGQAQARIEKYVRLFAEVEKLCETDSASKAVSRVLAALAHVGSVPADMQIHPITPHRARDMADAVIELIGADNALPKCETQGRQLREMGAAQDRTMALCRMRARWLRQSAAMQAEDHPGDAALAGKVQAKVEAVLYGKR
jgi:hypothetical protein